jgi:hypothetical protein
VPYRVIQWATGAVGREALRAIIEHPDLELAGVLVYGEDKEGRDAGELCGLGPVGIAATRDREAVVRSEADCVCYAPLVPDLDDVCRLLASGKNVVATPFLFFPRAMDGALLVRLERACARGSASVHGTGINPGFMGDLLPLVLSGLCRRIERVHIQDVGNWSLYDSREMVFENARFGSSPEEAVLEGNAYLQFMGRLFEESIRMVAAGLGAELAGIETTQELAVAEEGFEIPTGRIPAGSVSGQRYRWVGRAAGGGLEIEMETLWTVGEDYPEGWPRPGHGWTVTIEGDPSLRTQLITAASFDPRKRAPLSAHVASAWVATAMHAVNAIAPLCESEPGIRTFLDLPLVTGRGCARSGAAARGRSG